MSPAEAWIDLVIRRAPDLQKAGILSIGCDGNSAVLAAASPFGADADDRKDQQPGPPDEPNDAWENPVSYPTGSVPRIADVDDAESLPEIPQFGDD